MHLIRLQICQNSLKARLRDPASSVKGCLWPRRKVHFWRLLNFCLKNGFSGLHLSIKDVESCNLIPTFFADPVPQMGRLDFTKNLEPFLLKLAPEWNNKSMAIPNSGFWGMSRHFSSCPLARTDRRDPFSLILVCSDHMRQWLRDGDYV